MKIQFLMMSFLASAACAAELEFREPAIVPTPTKVVFEKNTEVRLKDGIRVVLVCSEDGKAWVEDRFAKWFGVKPEVEVDNTVRSAPSRTGAYGLKVSPNLIEICASSLLGVKYAMYTLRQATERLSEGVTLQGYHLAAMEVSDTPELDFRALHVCWFPEQSATLIEHQIRQAAYYKFNYVILESWGVFKSERHPKICVENAPLTVAEAHRLASLARDLGVIIIPQVNIFGHASMSRGIVGKHVTLDVHPELQPLFEPQSGWNWCLSNPAARAVVRDLADEVHAAFDRPEYFHLGCDEADAPSCAKCRAAKPYASLVAQHIREAHDMFAKKGVQTLMWHDMLLERGDKRWQGLVANGSRDEAAMLKDLPKDMIICDWYYDGARKDYPSLDYFMTNGFRTVTCSWNNLEGIVAQGKFAREHKLFGFMETLWHHYRGQEFVEMMRLSAQAAWNGKEPYGSVWCNPFATHWRQTGWDQGIRDWREHGYNDGQVTRDILDR